nr:MAG TPA: hypothetical protein [Caudoviricetes sp.]DAY70594.1 MAG TPA: hypothetical protein [Caudoviricetes sp.]
MFRLDNISLEIKFLGQTIFTHNVSRLPRHHNALLLNYKYLLKLSPIKGKINIS